MKKNCVSSWLLTKTLLLLRRKIVYDFISRKDTCRQTIVLTNVGMTMGAGSQGAVELWLGCFGVLRTRFESTKLLGDSVHLRQYLILFHLYLRLGSCLYLRVKMCSPHKGHGLLTHRVTKIIVLQLFSYN
jgi:hypothetical protein